MKRETRNFLFRRDDQRPCRACGQRQIKPTRTVGVTAIDLAAARFDRVRNVFAPLRLRMKFAPVAKRAELAVRRRRERKTRLVRQRPGVGAEMLFRSGIALGFVVKIAVFDIHAHGQPNGRRDAVDSFAGTGEFQDGRVLSSQHLGGHFSFSRASVPGVGDKTPVRWRPRLKRSEVVRVQR